jgi:hypothetical protein
MLQAVEDNVNEALQTWDCKAPGCEATAYKATGPYTMLCHFHTEQAKRARRASLKGTGPPPPPGAQSNGAASLEFRAASLVEIGRNVDPGQGGARAGPGRLRGGVQAVAGSGRAAARC